MLVGCSIYKIYSKLLSLISQIGWIREIEHFNSLLQISINFVFKRTWSIIVFFKPYKENGDIFFGEFFVESVIRHMTLKDND